MYKLAAQLNPLMMQRIVSLTTACTLLLAIAAPLRAAVNVGDTPALSFRATDGTTINRESLDGKIVVMDFWATWCGPCVEAMPHMKKLHADYADKGVQIIGISLDSDRQAFDQFIKQRNLPWPQYFDGQGWDNRISKRFGVPSIPHIFILSPEGQVLWKGHPGQMDEPLQRALIEHPPRPRVDEAVVEQAVESLREARQAIAQGEYYHILARTMAVPDAAVSDPRVAAGLVVLGEQLRAQATGDAELEQALAANPEATARFRDMLARAVEVSQSHTPKTAESVLESKFADAEQAADQGNHVEAYEDYQWLVEQSPATRFGVLAGDRMAAYEQDPQFAAELEARSEQAQAQEQAKELLTLAKNYELADRPELARKAYQQILDEHPQAERCCDEARKALARLQ